MMQTVGCWMLGFAAFIASVNFSLSFVRPLIYWLLGWERRNISGIPGIGTLFLIVALALLKWSAIVWVSAIVLCVIDTCGLPWFCAVMMWEAMRRGRT